MGGSFRQLRRRATALAGAAAGIEFDAGAAEADAGGADVDEAAAGA